MSDLVLRNIRTGKEYELMGFRAPQIGEHYLSIVSQNVICRYGAIYEDTDHSSNKRFIVRPADAVVIWNPKDEGAFWAISVLTNSSHSFIRGGSGKYYSQKSNSWWCNVFENLRDPDFIQQCGFDSRNIAFSVAYQLADKYQKEWDRWNANGRQGSVFSETISLIPRDIVQ